MKKTVRFTISMTAAEFRELESLRRKTGLTRSRILRDALRDLNPAKLRAPTVREGGVEYGSEKLRALIDPAERKRRAITAAGRFRSNVSDLSECHDLYFAEASAQAAAGNGSDKEE